MKVTMSASMIESIKDAEEQLRNEGLPKELEGLPSGHPLVVKWQEEKARWDEIVLREKQQAQRKVKAKERYDSKKKQAENDNERRTRAAQESADSVNAKIGECMTKIRELSEVIERDGKFDNHPFAKARMMRLTRMLTAAYRGLDESRLSSSRFSY